MSTEAHEDLVRRLKDPEALRQYMAECDTFVPSRLERMLGGILVGFGNVVYGKQPSYEKFKAVEVIARIPYQSWESVAYTLLTAFYSNEDRAIRLSKILPFARHAQDNETMHVVVISQIVKKYGRNSMMRHTFIPIFFSFFYYWGVWILSFFEKQAAFHLNYLFEQHAFDQYSEFLKMRGEELKRLPVESHYLNFYGRPCANQYELFDSIRIDEAIHRNCSLTMARELEKGRVQ